MPLCNHVGPRPAGAAASGRCRARGLTRNLTLSLALGLALSLSLWGGSPGRAAAKEPAPAAAPAKSLILLIADGCGLAHYTLARWVKGAPLALDRMNSGTLATWAADSVTPDSAAAATAFAAGQRTDADVIGLGPAGPDLWGQPLPAGVPPHRPLATILEGARLAGKSIGLVATSRVTHATPASFAAHVIDRQDQAQIMAQMAYQHLDVLMGGGYNLLHPAAQGGKRKDNKDFRTLMRQTGILARDARELKGAPLARIFGFFAPSHMAPEVDRARIAPDQPTLEEMTAKALQTLGANNQGFFLMVEGSQVDWGSHANDPAHMLGDLLQFDRAVAVALDYAAHHRGTLVVAVSDHDTGGLSVGNARSDLNYDQMKPAALLEPLAKMRASAGAIWEMAGPNPTPERLQALVKEWWGQEPNLDEARRMLAIGQKGREHPKLFGEDYGVGEVFSAEHTLVGWTTHGHTGNDVPWFALGPGAPTGHLDAPTLGQALARALGVDLPATTARLFVNARQVFPPEMLQVQVGPTGDRVVEIRLGGKLARLTVNQERIFWDNHYRRLEGLVLEPEPGGPVYVPQQAVEIIKGQVPTGKAEGR
ncbi:MAG: alkaline phosphatase [Deltaproteobacteria bacterium]|nr:alkaline phosphatase [Deltaproteobacteria bacterium]